MYYKRIDQPEDKDKIYGYINLDNKYYEWISNKEFFVDLCIFYLTEPKFYEKSFYLMKYHPDEDWPAFKFDLDLEWEKKLKIHQRLLLKALKVYNFNLGD